MPSCLHLLNAYLPATETFIWQYLSQARDFLPLVLAERLENLDRFPLPRATFLSRRPVKGRLPSLIARLRGRYAQADYSACLAEARSLRPDVVHVHNGYRAIASLDFCEALGRPRAINFYGSDVSERAFLRRARDAYRRLFATASAFLVEGPAMSRKLAALGCPEDRIRLQRIAIDPSAYPFRERTWDGNRPIRFLFVGRLVEKKGLEYALKALAACGGSFPWDFTVVGDGPLRGAMEALADRLGMSSRIRITGYLPLAEIRTLMDVHDVLLQPSCTAAGGDGEGGAPTVLLEAQACGLPVVSTVHDDIPYVAAGGEDALLARERDVEDLARLLRSLAEGHAGWPGRSRRGRRHVEERHDARKEILALEGVYREILGRG